MSFEALVGAISARETAEAQEDAIRDQQRANEEYLRELWARYEAYDPLWTYVDPLASEQMGAVSNEVALMLGQPAGAAGRRGSPKSQMFSIASAMGYDLRDTDERQKGFEAASRAMGYGSRRELMQDHERWLGDQEQWVRDTEETRLAILEGRMGGYENLAALMEDFPVPTRGGFEAERGRQLESRLAEIGLSRDRAAQRIYEEANMMGTNPAGAIGLLEEQIALQERQAGSEADITALNILSGLVGAGTQAIGGLQSGLLPGVEAGLSLSGQATQGLASLGNIAAQQANSYNDLFRTMLGADYGLSTIPYEYLVGQNRANLIAAQGQSAINTLGQYNPSTLVNSYLGNAPSYATTSGGTGGAGYSGLGAGPATGATAGGVDVATSRYGFGGF